MTDSKKPQRQGHPYDGAADAAATATKHTRIIPDGAHYSGLGKDYGGMYNPDYKSDLDRLVEALNITLDALLYYDGHASDPHNRHGWSEQDGYLAYMTGCKCLANLNKTDGE